MIKNPKSIHGKAADLTHPPSNEDIVRYFKERTARLPTVATTHTPSGQILDWIAKESQHASGIIANPPPTSGSLTGKIADLKLASFELSDLAAARGPVGTVPILRKDFSRLSVTKSLQEYLSKPGRRQMNRNRILADPDPFKYFHAHASQSVTCFGAEGYLNVWNPYIENSSDHSISQVWLVNSDNPQVQTIEAGWVVSHDRSGDWQPHLFVYYTTNGYTKDGDHLGGWNAEQDGWVQYDQNIYPGALLVGMSEQGGTQTALQIKFQFFENNWWFQVNGIWIGYYPASLFLGNQSIFNSIGDHASSADFGGEVYSDNTNPNTSNSQMGSGDFSEGGWGYASFLANLRFQTDKNGTMKDLNGTAAAENPSLYDVQPQMLSGTAQGSYLLMGGPGTQRSRMTPALVAFDKGISLGFIADNNTKDILLCATPGPFVDNTWSGNTPAGQSSKAGPSMAVFLDKLWMAFVANDNANELLICSSSDGLHWSANTQVQGQFSKAAPALAVFGNLLWVAFVANDNSNELLVCSSQDGLNWSGNISVGQSSKAGPSLAVFNNKLWMAFIANDNANELLICSTINGLNWLGNTQVQGQFSKATPSLAVFNNQLWVAFVANDNTNGLLICSSKNGLNWSGNTPVQGQFSQTAPSLEVFDNQLNIAFVANNEPPVLLICSSADGLVWNGNFIV